MGHVSAPLKPPPHERCSWANRFDDPRREYRTLYCAALPSTCLRESLASFRPNLKALKELEEELGERLAVAGLVPEEWRRSNVLAPGQIELLSGELRDLEDLALRRELEPRFADLLVKHGMDHLDISELRSRTRTVTKSISRFLYESGAAGILYRSNLDNGPCAALFEGRARLVPDGEPEPLSGNFPALHEVCAELGLVLRGL